MNNLTREEYMKFFCPVSDVSTAKLKRETVRKLKQKGYKTSKVWKMPRKQVNAIYQKYE